jgi:hypothetical protein
MILEGFGFSGYRSFGGNLSRLFPLGKINLIVGTNNSGKSNIVSFLDTQYSDFVLLARGRNRGSEHAFNELDYHHSDEKVAHRIAFPVARDAVSELIRKRLPDETQHVFQRGFAKKVLDSAVFTAEDGNVWFVYGSSSPSRDFALEYNGDAVSSLLSEREWQSLWGALTRKGGGGLQHWIPEAIQALSVVPDRSPPVQVLPAIRRIGKKGSEPDDFSGEGIIERLARIQNPPHNQQKLKAQFQAINEFVRVVLGNTTATIEIPYERDVVLAARG